MEVGMNIEKLKEWMDFAQQCGEGEYWEELLDAKTESAGRKRTGKIEYPLVDIVQTNTEIIVTAEIPGVKKEDLSLSVSGNILRLKGSPRIDRILGQEVLSERYSGSYERQIQLPSPVEHTVISAGLADGLLTIRFRHAGLVEEKILLE
jgi:HSP20 family protein